MSPRWATVSKHLFRRTALREKRHLENLQLVGVRGRAELKRLGVSPNAQLRVAPKRWHGYWQIEQFV